MHIVIIDTADGKECFGPMKKEKIVELLEDRRFRVTREFPDIWNKQTGEETITARIFICRPRTEMPRF